jgi:hypothetical protein
MKTLLSEEQEPIDTSYVYNKSSTLSSEKVLRFNDKSTIEMVKYILELRKINNIEFDYESDLYKLAENSKTFIWYYNLSKNNNSSFDVNIEDLLNYYKVEKNYELSCFLIKQLIDNNNDRSVVYNIWENNKRKKSWSDKVRQLYKDYIKYKGTKNEHLLYVAHPTLKNDNINKEIVSNERLITDFHLFLNKIEKN